MKCQGREVIQCFPGSQIRFVTCPVGEILYEGTRSPGKSFALLMKFLAYVGQGFGVEWRGIIFRRTKDALSDLVLKSQQVICATTPLYQVSYNKMLSTWEWSTGETLRFSYMDSSLDYYKVAHGKEWPFIVFDELTTWKDLECYDLVKSSWRTTYRGAKTMPKYYLSACNPHGIGHDAVKRRFVDPAPAGQIIKDELGTRVRIQGHFSENLKLVQTDQDYIRELANIEDPVLRAAWFSGDWDLAISGILSNFWDRNIHVIKPFKIPGNWYMDRSYDWGSSAPYAVLYFAESNGETAPNGRTYPKGTLFVIRELYGAKELPNGKFVGLQETTEQVSAKILEFDAALNHKVNPGPADNSVWDVLDGDSIGAKMEKLGVCWTRSDKGKGSRVAGVQTICSLLSASKKVPQEEPGLYFFDNCVHSIRTIPTIPRDPKNPDDCDTNSEDHCFDVLKYRSNCPKIIAGMVEITGF